MILLSAIYLEPFESGISTFKRQPGSTSRRILQEEAEEGQPVMRSEPKKSLSPDEKLLHENIFWPRYSENVKVILYEQ